MRIGRKSRFNARKIEDYIGMECLFRSGGFDWERCVIEDVKEGIVKYRLLDCDSPYSRYAEAEALEREWTGFMVSPFSQAECDHVWIYYDDGKSERTEIRECMKCHAKECIPNHGRNDGNADWMPLNSTTVVS